MPLPSIQNYINTRQTEIASAVLLRRAFKSQLKKLRNLPSGELTRHWYMDSIICLKYKAKFLDMRDSAKYLDKFALIAPLEDIDSEDSDDGVRTFFVRIRKGDYTLHLTLEAEPFTQEENPLANCRKVQVGVDTHTYTSTTPRYQLICD
jgi:hypothetical protein